MIVLHAAKDKTGKLVECSVKAELKKDKTSNLWIDIQNTWRHTALLANSLLLMLI